MAGILFFKSRLIALAMVLTSSVVASPGRPCSSKCPPVAREQCDHHALNRDDIVLPIFWRTPLPETFSGKWSSGAECVLR